LRSTGRVEGRATYCFLEARVVPERSGRSLGERRENCSHPVKTRPFYSQQKAAPRNFAAFVTCFFLAEKKQQNSCGA
jgi:hypothetical protein